MDEFYLYLLFPPHQAVLVPLGGPLVPLAPFGLLVPLDLVHLKKNEEVFSFGFCLDQVQICMVWTSKKYVQC